MSGVSLPEARAIGNRGARVYGGIHFEFELTAAAVSCTKVADYVFTNYMKLR
ncbi:MAG: hypothetical protein ABI702_24875 [Burkholderiales bacterium]